MTDNEKPAAYISAETQTVELRVGSRFLLVPFALLPALSDEVKRAELEIAWMQFAQERHRGSP